MTRIVKIMSRKIDAAAVGHSGAYLMVEQFFVRASTSPPFE